MHGPRVRLIISTENLFANAQSHLSDASGLICSNWEFFFLLFFRGFCFARFALVAITATHDYQSQVTFDCESKETKNCDEHNDDDDDEATTEETKKQEEEEEDENTRKSSVALTDTLIREEEVNIFFFFFFFIFFFFTI